MRPFNVGGRQGRGDPPFLHRTRTSCRARLVAWCRRDPAALVIVLVLLWAAFAFAWEWFMVRLNT